MHFDIIVNGGGMVGAATAIAAAQQGYSVAVIEQHTPQQYGAHQPMDLRVSAINLASESLLDELGVWSNLLQMRMAQFNRLSVWEESARTDFTREQINRDHLGYIVENRLIQLALWQGFEDLPIRVFEAVQLDTMTETEAGWKVTLSDQQQISADLLIGADGAQSKVRQQLGIGLQGWNYRHHALVIGITTHFEPQDITWQQMTCDGPRAFLPLAGDNGSLVWYDSAARVAQLKRLNPEQLKQQVIKHFPPLAGDFEVQAVASFPLTRRHANSYVGHSALILGDAAHTINPLAGQGVNLGFKDVRAFKNMIERAKQQGVAVNDKALLRRYEKARRADNLLMISAMDAIYASFSNQIAPLKGLRKLGLSLVNQMTPIKSVALKYATGVIG